MSIINRHLVSCLLMIALGAAVAVYLPGLHGDLLFDDIPNLIQNTRLRITDWNPAQIWQASQAGISGELGRPLAMLSFALNHLTTGLDPFYLKLTNLVIHLLCGVGLFVLTRLLLLGLERTGRDGAWPAGGRWLALIVASAWLLHPLNLTPVLYVVQRMTSLSALFVILGLIAYTWGRLRILDGRWGIPYLIAGVGIAGPLAVLSKENGALLPLYMVLVELTVFRLRGASSRSRLAIAIFFGLVLVLPTLWLAYRIMGNPGLITGGYGLRDFTLTERLLTESRALWFYMQQVVLPNPSRMGLYHDDFTVSTGWLEPPTTLLAVLGLAALLVLGWALRRRAPLAAFGILFFLAGHSMESTMIPLELVHEHRNYLPAYGLLLALFASVLRVDGLPLLSLRQKAAIVYVLLLSISTSLRAADWGNPLRLTVTWAERQPTSARAQHEAGRVYARLFAADPEKNPELYERARRYMLAAASADPRDTVGLASLIILHWHADRPVEPQWATELERRLADFPIRPATASIFEAFIRCRRASDCPLDHATTVRLFEAAITNPQAGTARRAHLHDLFARYYAEVVGDPSHALDYMHRATQLAPGQLQHRINLIELLTVYGQTEAARQQLEIARDQDRWHAFGPKLDELETRLTQMDTAAP